MRDTRAVEQFLRVEFGDDVDHVEYVGAGAWSECFGFTDPEGSFVVRFGHHVDDFDKDRLAARFATFGLPVPGFRALGRTTDDWYVVTRRVRGDPIEELDAAGWSAVVPSLFAALDAMADADLGSMSGFGGWDRSGHAPHPTWRDHLMSVGIDTPDRRTHGWRRKLAESSIGERLLDAAVAALNDVADACPTGERGLIHSDLINRNVLVDTGRITGIFDWGCSMYGDPIFDLAWLSFWSPWHPGLQSVNIVDRWQAHATATGRSLSGFDDRLRACHLAIGIDHLGYNAFMNRWDDLATLAEYFERFVDS